MSSHDGELPWLDGGTREQVCSTLAVRPRGLLTDVDGTISAIAPAPADAVLLPGVAELLAQACTVFDVVAAISGRSAADARRLVGVPGIIYVGNHGLECIKATAEGAEEVQVLPAVQPYVETINAALDDVEDALSPRFPGMVVERKGASGSVHVRATSEPEIAEEAVTRALTAIALPRGLRVTHGKLVVELRPPLAVDKGTAVTGLVRSFGLRGALYLGDDRTDIDAFRALHQLCIDEQCRGVTVAILHPEAPPDLAGEADVVLDSIEHVPAFLRWVLANT